MTLLPALRRANPQSIARSISEEPKDRNRAPNKGKNSCGRTFVSIAHGVKWSGNAISDSDHKRGSRHVNSTDEESAKNCREPLNKVLVSAHCIVELEPGLVRKLVSIEAITSIRKAANGRACFAAKSCLVLVLELLHKLAFSGREVFHSHWNDHSIADDETFDTQDHCTQQNPRVEVRYLDVESHLYYYL